MSDIRKASESPRGTGATLASLLDMTNRQLEQRLEGITDEEWLWEPTSECWSIRDGKVDFAVPDPSPAPFTTIAWRLHHLQACNEIELRWLLDENVGSEVRVPRSAEEGVQLWLHSATALRNTVGRLSDADLEEANKRGFPRIRGLPRIFFAATLVRENIHHGAEIGVLRDLYRYR